MKIVPYTDSERITLATLLVLWHLALLAIGAWLGGWRG